MFHRQVITAGERELEKKIKTQITSVGGATYCVVCTGTLVIGRVAGAGVFGWLRSRIFCPAPAPIFFFGSVSR